MSMSFEDYKSKVFLKRGREYEIIESSYSQNKPIKVIQHDLVTNEVKRKFKCMAYELLDSSFNLNERNQYNKIKIKIASLLDKYNVPYNMNSMLTSINIKDDFFMDVFVDFSINKGDYIISLDWANCFNNFHYPNSYYDYKHEYLDRYYNCDCRFFNLLIPEEKRRLMRLIKKICTNQYYHDRYSS